MEKDIAIVEQRIQEKLKPYAAEVTLLDEIPGVDTALAGAIVAELGADMSVFENVSQLASWAGVTRNLVYRLGYTVTLELKAA